MKKAFAVGLMFAALFFNPCSPVLAEDLSVGEPAPDFALKDTQGNDQSLSAYKGKFVVLEWTNYDCPFVQKMYDSATMQGLQKTYTDKGVVWLSINSSAPGKQGNYPPEAWNAMIATRGAAPTAVLLDPDGKVGRLYGAKTTPHMFIVDPSGSLIYQGAIDNVPSAEAEDVAAAKNYVRAALEEAMAGKPVSEPSTKAYGCSVKY